MKTQAGSVRRVARGMVLLAASMVTALVVAIAVGQLLVDTLASG